HVHALSNANLPGAASIISRQNWNEIGFQVDFSNFDSHSARMQSHELLREVFQKTSAKQVAADLNLSLSMIYKWAEPDDGTGSGTINPLDRVEALIRSTNDKRLVQWI